MEARHQQRKHSVISWLFTLYYERGGSHSKLAASSNQHSHYVHAYNYFALYAFLSLMPQQWHHQLLAVHLPKLHIFHNVWHVCQSAILNFQGMMSNAPIVQPVLGQRK